MKLIFYNIHTQFEAIVLYLMICNDKNRIARERHTRSKILLKTREKKNALVLNQHYIAF